MEEEDELMIKERMRHVLSFKRMSVARFAENNESKRIKYRRYINGTGDVPYAVVIRMLRMFPDISAEWLVTGEGEMLKSDNSKAIYSTHNVVRGNTSGNIGNISIGNYKQIIAEKDKRIAELEHDKKMLQDVLAALSQTTREKYGPKQ